VLTVKLVNAGTVAISGAGVSIPLPVGTKSTSQFAVGSPCSSSGFSLGSQFLVSGVTIPAGATCTNTITLTPSSAGTFIFTPSTLVSVTAGTTATLVTN
jgi:hypothetical protein